VNIHDNSLTEERIYAMLLDATRRMVKESNKTVEWLEGLKTMQWSIQRLKSAVLDVLLQGIVPPSALAKFSVSIADERSVSKQITPYLLQNAVTRFYRDRSFQLQHDRVNRVNAYLKKII
jgi:hypothetical protein